MRENEETFHYVRPCSTQDLTGLIPAGPIDDGELENYEELYPFLPKVPTSLREPRKT